MEVARHGLQGFSSKHSLGLVITTREPEPHPRLLNRNLHFKRVPG